MRNQLWDRSFAAYRDFKKEYGREPKYNDVYNEVQIGIWCSNQKSRYRAGALSKERELLLRKEEFDFGISYEKDWYRKLEIYKEFRNKFQKEPRSQEIYKDIQLGAWRCSIRTRYKQGNLSEENASILKEGGFCF